MHVTRRSCQFTSGNPKAKPNPQASALAGWDVTARLARLLLVKLSAVELVIWVLLRWPRRRVVCHRPAVLHVEAGHVGQPLRRQPGPLPPIGQPGRAPAVGVLALDVRAAAGPPAPSIPRPTRKGKRILDQGGLPAVAAALLLNHRRSSTPWSVAGAGRLSGCHGTGRIAQVRPRVSGDPGKQNITS
jgi:hypothetical protein